MALAKKKLAAAPTIIILLKGRVPAEPAAARRSRRCADKIK